MLSVHTDLQKRGVPHAVLVFCWLDDGVVWVKHALRGWEVPGGKVESGESPEEAARREVWEEAGITVDRLRWIGEYALAPNDLENGSSSAAVQRKWVYEALVDDIGARKAVTEILDVRVFRPQLGPEDVVGVPQFSYVMQDTAFMKLWPFIKGFTRE